MHKTWVIKDCKGVIKAGVVLEKCSILIKDGLIQQVSKNLIPPLDAEVISGEQLTVYPGFIDVLSPSLLKFPTQKPDLTKIYTGDFNDKDKGITPDLRSFDYVKFTKSEIKKYHQQLEHC